MKRKPFRKILNLILLLLILVCGGAIGLLNMSRMKTDDKLEEQSIQEQNNANQIAAKPVKLSDDVLKSEKIVRRPDVDEQLLTVNPYSRPGKKIKKIKAVVIHYLGNPETTAQQNRDYFESLKDLKNTYMSSNYIIGLDGEIIQCVPDNEVAYASNQANNYSISIENCNIDSTGKFMRETYISLVKLVAYLSAEYNLNRNQILRHHDITGKECPRYYVENEGSWETFLDDVMNYRAICEAGDILFFDPDVDLKGLKETYQSKDEKQKGDIHADKDSEHGGEFEGRGTKEEEEEDWDPYEGYDEDFGYEDDYYEGSYDDSYDNSYDYGNDNYYGNDDYYDPVYPEQPDRYDPPVSGDDGGGNMQEYPSGGDGTDMGDTPPMEEIPPAEDWGGGDGMAEPSETMDTGIEAFSGEEITGE